MRNLWVALAVSLWANSAAVSAQDADQQPSWEQEVQIEAYPTLGKDIGPDNSLTNSDYSEYAGYFTLRRKEGFMGQDVAVRLGSAYDPDQFGDDLESRVQGEFTIGAQKYAARRGRIFSRNVGPTDDSWKWWGTAGLAHVWDGFYSGDDHTDKTLSLGGSYTNVVTVVPNHSGAAKGISYQLAVSAARMWSSRDTESRWAPRVTGVIYSPSLKGVVRVFARGDYEVRIYDLPRAGMIEDRLDHRTKVTFGADFAEWFGGSVDTAELAAMYFRRSSNAPAADFDRVYFAPGLVLLKSF